MRKLREFHCHMCHRIHERLVKDEETVAECKYCDANAKRIISAAMTNGNCAHGYLKRNVLPTAKKAD